MSKEEFLSTLKTELEKQNLGNVENMLQFYDEMICDRMEDGMTEEEATASLGSIQDIVKEVVWEKPVTTLVKERVQQSKAKAESNGKGAIWIVLAVLGFPIWLPIAAVIAVCFMVICLVYWIIVLTIALVLLVFPLTTLACLVGAAGVLLGFAPFSTMMICLGGAMILGSLSFLLYKPCLLFFKETGTVFAKMLVGLKKTLFK
jgi:uncharacterized membrane protein